MTQIVCPTCASTLEVDDGVIGQQVQCGSCQEVFVAEEPKKSKSGKSSKSKSRSRRDDGDDDYDERPSGKRRRSRRDDDDDYDDYDDGSTPRKSKGNGQAVTSMVLGIVAIVIELPAFGSSFAASVCCCGFLAFPMHGVGVICAIIGIIMGIVSMKDKKAKAQWLTGMILSGISLLLAIAGVIISIAIPAAIIATTPTGPAWTPPPPQPRFTPPPPQPPKPNPFPRP